MPVFRFSNAVSDISKFIQTYRVLFNELREARSFTHDDAAKVLINYGLVSSQGAIGEEALRRSTREDRSRDPLYNQHKMYSEIYRMLGWYVPAGSRTQFRMSEFGEYIYESRGKIERQLFQLNVIHIVSPNPLVDVKSGNILRPIPLIIRLMSELGFIHRDEIIYAVLSLENDRDKDVFERTVDMIKYSRKTNSKNTQIDSLVEKNKISRNTLQNYTRFPLATLRYLGLADKEWINGVYGEGKELFYVATEKAINLARELNQSIDIRYSEMSNYSINERASFCYFAIMFQLQKIGFQMDNETKENYDRSIILSEKIIKDNNADLEKGGLLFFPYQESPSHEMLLMDKLFDS